MSHRFSKEYSSGFFPSPRLVALPMLEGSGCPNILSMAGEKKKKMDICFSLEYYRLVKYKQPCLEIKFQVPSIFFTLTMTPSEPTLSLIYHAKSYFTINICHKARYSKERMAMELSYFWHHLLLFLGLKDLPLYW